MNAVETLVRQLAAIQNQLIALPDDAFTQRFELLRRQEELRSAAAHHAAGTDMERPTEDLLAELVSLRLQLDRTDRGTVSPASKSGVSGLSRYRIEGRIGRIKDILIDRGADPV